jgi:zinc protease
MADLSAASLDDVKAFFRTYYAPDNAVLSITGDVDPARTLALVTKYFGSIPMGPTIQRPTVAPVTLSGTKRLVLEDPKASLPQLAIAWPTVGEDSPDARALDALGEVLTLDRTSRLTKLLVYDRQLATAVEAGQESNENSGRFEIDVRPRPGVPLTDIERLVDSVVDAAVATSPADSEVARAKNYEVVGTITGLESVQRRGETMASGQTFFGDPLHYLTELREQQAVTAADVHRVAQHYLTPSRVILSMVPAGKLDQVSRPTEPFTNVTAQAEGR